ncbi:hypothetical protein GE061_019121 [Apolygus lucorum]|uniref:Uncharacterized protein n=1 Tax=Apolygus lucorum TaxID=248454 RepID=A0A8S9X8X1_APOLU|nr:hypothetical protein GE061_019121 [Apolygus lucorum]
MGRHGRHSQRLRAAVATLANKLANENVSWESMQALVASRLVALDKCPGVRRRILGKYMAEVTGEDVTVACGEKQLCGVHPDDIEEAKERFSGTGITVVTGQRLLGGYVADKEGKQAYLKKKMEKWTDSIKKISMASITQPQSAYVAFTKSVQF